jgi:hypothetical protein
MKFLTYKIYDTHNSKIKEKKEPSKERNTSENAVVFVRIPKLKNKKKTKQL